MKKSARVVVPGRVLAGPLLAVAVPAGLTLILAIGTSWPRDMAPGSGLKLAGLVLTGLTTVVAWRTAVRSVEEPRVRRIGAVLALMVGLLAWPFWSVGVLPSVNGALLRDMRTVEMTLDRTEATTIRRSRDLHHWAWLIAPESEPGIGRGRYFIDPQTYDRLTADPPDRVLIDVAAGLLGAVVVTGIR